MVRLVFDGERELGLEGFNQEFSYDKYYGFEGYFKKVEGGKLAIRVFIDMRNVILLEVFFLFSIIRFFLGF